MFKRLSVAILIPFLSFAQVALPTKPSPNFPSYNIPLTSNVKQLKDIVPSHKSSQQLQNEKIMQEVEYNEEKSKEIVNQMCTDIEEASITFAYNLPSLSNIAGTKAYADAFKNMLRLDIENYSVKDVNFSIENAFFNNKENKAEFDKIINLSGKFLLDKMIELKYDSNSNLAKNFMLFQYFSETLQIKSSNQKHLPFTYDFGDYMGIKDHSKIFVTKLIETGSGQCRSMPLLYLILAEEIGAEAFLSLSPNHSYIKFRDDRNKWYNIELTNGMFTANSFILDSGYIKAEAMQNKIYMQSLSKKELLSQFYVDLATGYIRKFGYDEFVSTVIDKALELSPKNVNAQMVKANYLSVKFDYVSWQLGINPRNREDLQRLKNFPRGLDMLIERNQQYQKIDELGFEQMPAEAYEKWLGSLKEAKNKVDDEKLKNQFKGLMIKQNKD